MSMHPLPKLFSVQTLRWVLSDRRASVMTWVGVSILPLLISVGMATDISRGFLLRSKLNSALDAAALAGARNLNADNRDDIIQQFFDANFPDDFMGATIEPLDIQLIQTEGDPDRLQVSAAAEVPTLFMNLIDIDDFDVGTSSEVTVSSKSVEVSLVLDVTGSMSGQRIADLKDAAKELVDIVVQDDQDPFFSKVALVPYSMAVNAGEYADDVRGFIPGPVAIDQIDQTYPARVTTAEPHGFEPGDKVYIADVNGMDELNLNDYNIANPTQTTFELQNINGVFLNTYTGDGIVGRVCNEPGCAFFEFTAKFGTQRTHMISTCVSERTGSEAFTDVAPDLSNQPFALGTPAGDPVGLVYPNTPFAAPETNSALNPCPESEIYPLSSDRNALKAKIEDLETDGSTAGQIGVAWGWYMLSPNFAQFFPAGRGGAAHDPQTLLKASVIMTDGAFNTVYCQGIISKSSSSGSGNSSHHINCAAPNGDGFDQALELCDAMKNAGVIIYTVGLDIADSDDAENFINQCATDPSHVFFPDTGGDLRDAFREIAISISKLRLTR